MNLYFNPLVNGDDAEQLEIDLYLASNLFEDDRFTYCTVAGDITSVQEKINSCRDEITNVDIVLVSSYAETFFKEEFKAILSTSPHCLDGILNIYSDKGLCEEFTRSAQLEYLLDNIKNSVKAYRFADIEGALEQYAANHRTDSIFFAIVDRLKLWVRMLEAFYHPLLKRNDAFYPAISKIPKLDDIEKIRLKEVLARELLVLRSFKNTYRNVSIVSEMITKAVDFASLPEDVDKQLVNSLVASKGKIDVYLTWLSAYLHILARISHQQGQFNQAFLLAFRAIDIYVDAALMYFKRGEYQYQFGYYFMVDSKKNVGITARYKIVADCTSRYLRGDDKKVFSEIGALIHLRNRNLLTHGAIIINRSVSEHALNLSKEFLDIIDRISNVVSPAATLIGMGDSIRSYCWRSDLMRSAMQIFSIRIVE